MRGILLAEQFQRRNRHFIESCGLLQLPALLGKLRAAPAIDDRLPRPADHRRVVEMPGEPAQVFVAMRMEFFEHLSDAEVQARALCARELLVDHFPNEALAETKTSWAGPDDE